MMKNKYLRVFIATLLASSFVFTTHIELGFISIITCYVIITLFIEEIHIKVFERIFCPCISFVITTIFIILLHQWPIVLFILLLILMVLLSYIYGQDAIAYSMLLGTITVAIMLDSFITSTIHTAIIIGLFWIINIIVGAIIILLIFIETHRGKLLIVKNIKKELRNVRKEIISLFTGSLCLISLIIAIRVVLSILVLLAVNHFMHWQNMNIQATIATVIVAAQRTKTNAHQKGWQRIAGVLLGIFLALMIVFIIEIAPFIWLLILLMCIVLTLLSYACDKFVKFNYFFLQAGVLIPLVLYSPSHEGLDFLMAIQRCLGSIEGAIIGIIFYYVSWIFLRKLHKRRLVT